MEVDKLTVAELKNELKALKLATTGRKLEITSRLKTALDGEFGAGADSENDDTEDDDKNDDCSSSTTIHASGQSARRSVNQRATLTFKDVVDALEIFNGEASQNVHHWARNFQETPDIWG